MIRSSRQPRLGYGSPERLTLNDIPASLQLQFHGPGRENVGARRSLIVFVSEVEGKCISVLLQVETKHPRFQPPTRLLVTCDSALIIYYDHLNLVLFLPLSQ